jgi:hypothetical protein
VKQQNGHGCKISTCGNIEQYADKMIFQYRLKY